MYNYSYARMKGMIIMKQIPDGLRKEMTVLKTEEIMPNFAELSKKYHLDYRTIKKYYEGYQGKPAHHQKHSELEKYDDLIREKMNIPGVKISSIYFFLKTNEGFTGSYSSLTYYIRKHEIVKAQKSVGHPRYETEPGEQIQFDWIEEIQLTSTTGEAFEFNVFSAELSFSRFHYFEYSVTKTKEDTIRCLVNCFLFYGGVTDGLLTDNMSSIVNHQKNNAFIPEFNAMIKDFNMSASKCKVKHPYTKGKVEVRNKFMNWLKPFNNEITKEEDIINLIKKIQNEANNNVNSTTNMKPILLYQKEKEYLKPLPTNQIIEYYLNLNVAVKVNNSALIYYKGSQYSVPKKYINQTVKIKEIDNKLFIYYNTDLISTHDISDKKLNYHVNDYEELLSATMLDKDNDFIEQLAKKNLDLFDKLANLKEEGRKKDE